jgi:lipopolysaccharide biosynthesis regulator YciM
MEFEPWQLLVVPLLFLAGWWARGLDSRVKAADPRNAPRAMFRGLNLLLNEQADKAIDAFIEVVKLDPETIELHFALGNLFRRRGEIDRAVRIHNYLLSRADLPRRDRSNALAELGQDFLKGGMLDRAEEAFLRLRDDAEHRFPALRALLRIYQVEREWLKAVDCARLLEREAGESHQVAQGHFHCELADQSIAARDLAGARRHLDDALAVHRKSVRANLLVGKVAQLQGDAEAAIRAWQQLAGDRPDYLPLVAQPLVEALDAAGRRAEALNLLRRHLLDHPSIDLLELTARRVAEWEGLPAAEALLVTELKKHPSLLGFERLLAVRAELAQQPRTDGRAVIGGTTRVAEAPPQADDTGDALRQLIHAQTRRLARYRCGTCGFRAREYHWLCPGCASWDSYPPKRVEELGE